MVWRRTVARRRDRGHATCSGTVVEVPRYIGAGELSPWQPDASHVSCQSGLRSDWAVEKRVGAHVDGVVTEEQLLEVVSPSLSAVGLVCVTAARSCLSVAAGTAQADAVDHSVA